MGDIESSDRAFRELFKRRDVAQIGGRRASQTVITCRRACSGMNGVECKGGGVKSDRIEAILAEIRGTDILNLGCVNHSIALTEKEKERWLQLKLSERFPKANVLGLDIDQENVALMRAQGMNVEVGDAQRLNYHEKFDTVVLGEIIEHLENPGACLEGCRRALKPGGRIVLSTPNIFCVMHVLMYFKNYDHAFNSEHVAWFCPQTLRTMVERCGLRIETFKFVDDLAPDVVPDLPYRLFAYAWLGVRWIFPRRYRNTMVAVCVPSEKQDVAATVARDRSVASHV